MQYNNNRFYKISCLLVVCFVLFKFNYINNAFALANNNKNCSIYLEDVKIGKNYTRNCATNINTKKSQNPKQILNKKHQIIGNNKNHLGEISVNDNKNKFIQQKILNKTSEQDEQLQTINKDLQEISRQLK